jgi:FMN phosphatase YigB (HAD superfamily)
MAAYGPKSAMIRNLSLQWNLPLGEAVFFDDYLPNILDCQAAGIRSVQVPTALGVRMVDLQGAGISICTR